MHSCITGAASLLLLLTTRVTVNAITRYFVEVLIAGLLRRERPTEPGPIWNGLAHVIYKQKIHNLI